MKLLSIPETKSNIWLFCHQAPFGRFMRNPDENAQFLLEYPYRPDTGGNLRRIMALRYLVWAGLMDRIPVVGAIRPHTPTCDTRRRPQNTARLPPSTRGHLRSPSDFEQLGYEFCEDVPAAVVSD